MSHRPLFRLLALLMGTFLLAQCSAPRRVYSGGAAGEEWAAPMVVHTPSPSRLKSYETRALALTNAARRQHGRPPLRLNAQLADAARRQSLWMADQRVVGHHPTNLMARVEKSGYEARRVAENVMGPDAGYQVISLALCTPEGAIASWLRSPGHRKNLLNKDVTEVGFAYHDGYWTQILALPKDR